MSALADLKQKTIHCFIYSMAVKRKWAENSSTEQPNSTTTANRNGKNKANEVCLRAIWAWVYLSATRSFTMVSSSSWTSAQHKWLCLKSIKRKKNHFNFKHFQINNTEHGTHSIWKMEMVKSSQTKTNDVVSELLSNWND